MVAWDIGRPWYHGSPFALTVLRAGSTITPDRALAEAFSHKPALLAIDDEGCIKHDGTRPGYLYRLAEEIGPGDVAPHPRSTMASGLEWLTARELRLALVGPTQVSAATTLSAEEITALRHGPSPIPLDRDQ